MGASTTFTDQAADEIVRRLSEGEPLAQICRDDTMPGYRTVYDWMEAWPEFAANIARAREVGFDVIAVDCLLIADTKTEDHQSRRVRIETRLKLLAKWSPKKYGERTQIAPTDTEGNPAQFAPIMFVGVEAKEESE